MEIIPALATDKFRIFIVTPYNVLTHSLKSPYLSEVKHLCDWRYHFIQIQYELAVEIKKLGF